MNKILLPLFLLIGLMYNAQVGIDTTTPQTTLDVTGKPTDVSAKDGILVPRVTKVQLAGKGANTYAVPQNGALVYVTDITDPTGTPVSASQVLNITSIGFYFFDGNVWQKLSSTAGGDTTNDAWVNNTAATRVELVTSSNGTTARTTANSVVLTDGGRLGLGTGIANTDVPDAGIHLIGDGDGWKDDIRLDSYSGGNSTPGANFRFYGARGTKATPLAVQAGDVLGQVNFWAHDGTSFTGVARSRISSYYRSTSGADLIFSTGGATNNSMVITETGNVGINLAAPTTKLHIVSGGTSAAPVSAITIVDGNQASNRVLTSNANGVGRWSDVSVTKVTGVMVGAGTAIQILGGGTDATISNTSIALDNTATTYHLGSYIDLDPGKWEVEANVLIEIQHGILGLNNIYTKFSFTESTTIPTGVARTADILAGSPFLIGGLMTIFGAASGNTNPNYGVVNGKVVITNGSTGKKRYYLMYQQGIRKYSNFQAGTTAGSVQTATTSGASSPSYFNLGSSAHGENYISALRVQ